MDNKLILWKQTGAIGIIQLNRFDKRNALSLELLHQLNLRLQEIYADTSIRVLIIKGDNAIFSSGGDLKSMLNSGGEEAELMCLHVQDVFANIARLKIPVIAQLSGIVYGGGLELAMYCDIRIAANNTELCLPEVFHDLIPGAGGITMLTQIIGNAWAKYYILTGAQIPLSRALQTGLIHELVSIEDIEEYCLNLAKELSQHTPEVLQTIKQLVHENIFSSPAECLQSEAREFRSLLDRFGKQKIERFFSLKKNA
jgi:enoyl-CoA hydratase